jgi:hypothetical protein
MTSLTYPARQNNHAEVIQVVNTPGPAGIRVRQEKRIEA